jgi:hypothetical protein
MPPIGPTDMANHAVGGVVNPAVDICGIEQDVR